jgi:mRNA interferase MazF
VAVPVRTDADPIPAVLTRDPVADRIGSVVVAALTRTDRGLVSELALAAKDDGVPSDCVVNFDNVHTLARDSFRRHVTTPSPARMAQACRILSAATGC